MILLLGTPIYLGNITRRNEKSFQVERLIFANLSYDSAERYKFYRCVIQTGLFTQWDCHMKC